jgi:predicted MFS family arabinose efflux permease
MALLALAKTGFTCIATETLPAGLLPQIATGLGVSQAIAGQSVTLFAVGSLLAAIPLTVLTQTWARRTVLLLTVGLFLISNVLTAVAPTIETMLAARFVAGAASGLAWALLAGYARRMVTPHQQGKAMAVAMVGTPLGLSLGVPLGTWLGTTVGWRMSFGVAAATSLLLLAWIRAAVPNFPGQRAEQRIGVRAVLAIPGTKSVYAIVLFWMLAHNLLYTYVAPLVARAGLGERVDLVLLVFGVAALLGIALAGRVVDVALRPAVIATVVGFAAVALVFGAAGENPAAVWIGTALWGLTFGGAPTLLQTALADTAGEAADVAISINVVVWNGALAGGSLIGGLLLSSAGAQALPWAALVLAIVAAIVVAAAKGHGITAGARAAG